MGNQAGVQEGAEPRPSSAGAGPAPPADAAAPASLEALFDGAVPLPPGLPFSEMSDVAATLDGLHCVRHLRLRAASAVLTIAEDSVVKLTSGAIVNAANEGCLGGAGIDGVISRLGGDALAAAREALPEQDGVRCRTGDAKLTIAGDLPCDFVIHAVGPDFHCYPDQQDALALLASAYRSSMERAREQGVKRVAFCMLSAGIFRGTCALHDIVRTGLETIAQHAYPGLERVYLCAFTDEEREQLRDICSAMKQAAAGEEGSAAASEPAVAASGTPAAADPKPKLRPPPEAPARPPEPAAGEEAAASAAPAPTAEAAAAAEAPAEAAAAAPAGEDADGAEKPEKGAPKAKPRTLDQMMSLKPGDDERTELSKKISWILRHGAKKVELEMDEEGWVKMSDLTRCEILKGASEERLLSVINESNGQKMRYELKSCDEAGGGSKIRAISKSRRNAMLGKDRRERRRDAEGGEASGELRAERDRDRRGEKKEEGRSRRTQEAPTATYEEQVRDGFRPVYQGDTVVAMMRGDEVVRPGRREFPEKGTEKGKGKGKDKGSSFGAAPSGPGRPDGGSAGADEDDRRDREEKGQGRGRQDRNQRWRVVPDQEAIMRAAITVESDVVSTLHGGALVQQMGDEKVLKNGVIRMQVQCLDPPTNLIGWVTRSAEKAGGPVFFSPVGGNPRPDAERDRDRDRRGGKGRDRGDGKGRGKGKEGGGRRYQEG